MMNKTYDLIIIGAGPAGLTASIYASRYKLEHFVLGMVSGGQMSEIHAVENWPGEISISGNDLVGKFVQHVRHFGVEIKQEPVAKIVKEGDLFNVHGPKNKYLAKSVILALGAAYRRMNIPGEKELVGRGVSYCATCDAMFFRDKTVCVIGGGNSAAIVALELIDYAKKIYLICKEDKMTADPVWLQKIADNPKIILIKNTGVIEIKGKERVEKVVLDKAYEDQASLASDGVFIEIGTEPGVELAKEIGVTTDNGNYIIVKEDMSTNIAGIFAAGDMTIGSNRFRQIITAASEGAVAANSAYKFLKLKT